MNYTYLPPIQKVNAEIIKLFLILGKIYYLLVTTIKATFSKPFYLNRLIDQIIILGIGSVPLTIIIGLTMGSVMTLNFGHGLAKFGGVLYIPSVISISLLREMAPIFTSLLLAGRIGSGISAELGSMNVTGQIEAIRALGTSPIRVLVVPRFWATVISLPLLTGIAGILGILGGLLICNIEFAMAPGLFFNKVVTAVKISDVASGIIKSIFFAIVISLTACFKGLSTRHGTMGVGKSTTWVVVTASIIILILDFFLSKVFLLIWHN